MKNRHFELKRRKQREALRNYRDGSLIEKVSIFHLYSEEREKELTWWDDFSILLANRRLMVWFIHPRMAYLDECKNLAHEEVAHLYPATEKQDIFGETTKVYKRLGRSRKKVSGYRTLNLNSKLKEYYAAYDEAEKRICASSSVVIKPKFILESTTWAQGINLIVPERIATREDVVRVAHVAKDLYKGSTTLLDQYGDYQYTVDDWNSEQKIALESKVK